MEKLRTKVLYFLLLEFKSLFIFICNPIEYMNLHVYSFVHFLSPRTYRVFHKGRPGEPGSFQMKLQSSEAIWISIYVPCGGPSSTNTRCVSICSLHCFLFTYFSFGFNLFLFGIFVCIVAFKNIYRP